MIKCTLGFPVCVLVCILTCTPVMLNSFLVVSLDWYMYLVLPERAEEKRSRLKSKTKTNQITQLQLKWFSCSLSLLQYRIIKFKSKKILFTFIKVFLVIKNHQYYHHNIIIIINIIHLYVKVFLVVIWIIINIIIIISSLLTSSSHLYYLYTYLQRQHFKQTLLPLEPCVPFTTAVVPLTTFLTLINLPSCWWHRLHRSSNVSCLTTGPQ